MNCPAMPIVWRENDRFSYNTIIWMIDKQTESTGSTAGKQIDGDRQTTTIGRNGFPTAAYNVFETDKTATNDKEDARSERTKRWTKRTTKREAKGKVFFHRRHRGLFTLTVFSNAHRPDTQCGKHRQDNNCRVDIEGTLPHRQTSDTPPCWSSRRGGGKETKE